jgi:hypothetical protein
MKFRIVALLLALLAAGPASALIVGDDHDLGYIEFGIPSGDADRTAYVNHLIGMGLGTNDTALGQDFTRSNADFGALPTAIFGLNGTGTTINLGTTDFLYLFAKYDGPNYGSIVWYVGDLDGIITIPTGAGGESGSKYGLSGWTLFTGNGTTEVPEPGLLLMFGLGLAAVGLSRRRART